MIIWEDWINMIVRAMRAEDDSRWLRGDVMLEIEGRHGGLRAGSEDVYGGLGRWGRDVVDLVSWSTGETRWMLETCRHTSKSFPPKSRVPGMRWEHHRLAALSDDPDHWMSVACRDGLSVSQMKRRMDDEKARKENPTGYTCSVCKEVVSDSGGIFCRHEGVMSIFCSAKCLVEFFANRP